MENKRYEFTDEKTRLTAENENGSGYYPYCFREDTCSGEGNRNCVKCDFYVKVCNRLSEYERTGMTPKEITNLKKYNWIPVDEEVPENDSLVLLSLGKHTTVGIGRYVKSNDGLGAFYLGDTRMRCSWYGIFVNAWMPLPEPYVPLENEI